MSEHIDYKKSGVDTKRTDALVHWLQSSSIKKDSSASLSDIGGFASLYKPDLSKYEDPVIVSSTDGVGTKILLALEHNVLDNIGHDLVGMCVNDLYTIGADPLFFLDYFASGKIEPSQFKTILNSIKNALNLCEIPLLGGETAELPGLYSKHHFDLAGFVVGMVSKNRIIQKNFIKDKDVLLAIPSSGFHSNGYSLIRKWLEKKNIDASLLKNLLAPTNIYREIPQLCRNFFPHIHGIAHITGGGIPGNLSRVMPCNTMAHIDFSSLKTPIWMRQFIEYHTDKMENVGGVFNLGVGMILCVTNNIKNDIHDYLQEFNVPTYEIGQISTSPSSSPIVQILWES